MKQLTKYTTMLVVITIVLCLFSAVVSATTETFYPTIDTYVTSGNAQSNNSSTTLVASGGATDKKFIMHFDFSTYNVLETSSAYINLYIRGATGPSDGISPKYIKFYAADDTLTSSTVYTNVPNELMFLCKVHSYYNSGYWVKVDVTHYINRIMNKKELTVIGDIDGGLNDVQGFELTFDSNEGTNRPTLTLDRGTKPYDIDKMLSRDWEGDTIYNESILPIVYSAGTEAYAKLKMPATEIVSLTDYSMQTTYTYGTDYYLQDGKIYIPSGSSITFSQITDGGVTGKLNEFNFLYNINATTRTFKVPTYNINGEADTVNGGKGIYFGESVFHTSQLLVTYKHSGVWNSNYKPTSAASKFSNTISKLNAGEEVKIVVSGSSTSADANSSGSEMAIAPHLPGWGTLIAEGLEDHYNNYNVRYFNYAHGGQDTTTLGVPYASELANKNPDLVILGFFTNELGEASDYKTRILSIMSTVRAVNPNAEFLLIASYNTNPLSMYNSPKAWTNRDFNAYRDVLKEICASDDKAAFMDLGGMSDYLKQDKNYESMTGNNINHPNDYMHRMYAKMALTMICDDEVIPENPPTTTVQTTANYSEGFNALLTGVTDGWTLNASGADYANVLTNHLEIAKTINSDGYVEAVRSLGSYGYQFNEQMNMEMDFYLTGEGTQDTKIILPMAGFAWYELGLYINGNSLYLLSYNGDVSTKICDLTNNKLYTLKLKSIKTDGMARLYICSDDGIVYANDTFAISSNHGRFNTVVYRVSGVNTSFNLKRFVVDGRVDNYATRFDYFTDSAIPIDYTVTTNSVGSASIVEDPDFIKASSGLALVSNGTVPITATKDLGSSTIWGDYIKFSTTFAASVDANGADIYLERGNGAGSSVGLLAWLKLVRATTGEDATLTLLHRANYSTYNTIKTGITDLGKDHLLELYLNYSNSVYDVYFDGELIGKNYPFYHGPSTWKNVELISYNNVGAYGGGSNSFIIKEQNLTTLTAMPNNELEIIYDMKPYSLKGSNADYGLDMNSVDLYINNSTAETVIINNFACIYVDNKLANIRKMSTCGTNASSTSKVSYKFPYSAGDISSYKSNYGNANSTVVVKFFIWDSFQGMKPIGESLKIN